MVMLSTPAVFFLCRIVINRFIHRFILVRQNRYPSFYGSRSFRDNLLDGERTKPSQTVDKSVDNPAIIVIF